MSQSARSRRRATKALAEGRIPGRPGPKPKYTDEEFRAVIKARNAAYRAARRDEIREKAKLSYAERKAETLTPKQRGRPPKHRTPEEFAQANRKKAYRWRDKNRERFLKTLRDGSKRRLADKAIAEGRTPGLVGNPKRFQTQAERDGAHRRKQERYWAKRGTEEHRAHWRRHRHLRRARILGNGGSYTQEDIEWLFRKQKGKCVFCLKPLRAGFDIDHYLPLTKGGTNDRDNLRLMHRKCNSAKSARHPADHALKNGMLCW